ncbi:Uncharacterised protein [Segatella copri]|nr:Uncharacterised protein [Segatella copri]
MENHSHLAAHLDFFFFRHPDEVTVVVENFTTCRLKQSYEILHEYGLSGTALSDYQISLSCFKGDVYIV